MRFVLDTNAVIAVLKDSHGPTSLRLRSHEPHEVGVSAIVLHELYFGAFKSKRRDENLTRVEALRFEVVPFDSVDAFHAGEIRAQLALAGAPIGPFDLLIAGQALSRQLTLVTSNLREFQRVPGLALEDWAA